MVLSIASVDACSRGDFRGCPKASSKMVFFLLPIAAGKVSVVLSLQLLTLDLRLLLRRSISTSSSVVTSMTVALIFALVLVTLVAGN